MSELDPELAELYRAERAYEEVPPAGAAQRVLVGVRATVGGGSEGGGDGSPAGGARPATLRTVPLSRAIAGMIGSALVGGVVGAAIMHRQPPGAAEPPKLVVVEKTVAPPPPVPQIAVAPELLPSATPARASGTGGPSEPKLDARGLAAERALLDAARVALAKGDADAALDAVGRHEREFANGRLAEEREALAVRALVKAGRNEDARARGELFLRTYPHSLAAPAVRSALASLP